MLPRNLTPDFHAVCQLVEYDSLQDCIMLHDEFQIVEGVDEYAILVTNQRRLPVTALKLLRCCLSTLGEQQGRNEFIATGKFCHRRKGLLGVVVTELMDANEVKRIQEFF